MGGTCSGGHGVGLGKMKYLKAEHGEALNVMRTLKRALDQHDLMNRGKIQRMGDDRPLPRRATLWLPAGTRVASVTVDSLQRRHERVRSH